MKTLSYLNVTGLGLAFLSSLSFGRSVFLNGTDISSSKTQQLKKVDVKIDERGDVHIIAPHYHVQEESTFVPLSAGRVRIPVHENEPFEFRKEGDAPGVPPQFKHGTDKTAKTTDNAAVIKDQALLDQNKLDPNSKEPSSPKKSDGPKKSPLDVDQKKLEPSAGKN